jgi:hypothetical protein
VDSIDVLLATVGLPLLFGVNVVGLGPFGRLCRRIAEIEGRQTELNSLKSDDGGWNSFTQEQYMKLCRRDYRRFGDASLTVLGDRAFKWAALAGLVTLMAVAILVLHLSTHSP